MEPIVNSMLNMPGNSQNSKSELIGYYTMSSFSMFFKMLINAIIIYLILSINLKVMIIITFSMLLMDIGYDVLFLSSIAVIEPSLLSVGYSNILSPFTILILLLLYEIRNKEKFLNLFSPEIRREFKTREYKEYLRNGSLFALEALIRNLAYIFITLRIMGNLGTEE